MIDTREQLRREERKTNIILGSLVVLAGFIFIVMAVLW